MESPKCVDKTIVPPLLVAKIPDLVFVHRSRHRREIKFRNSGGACFHLATKTSPCRYEKFCSSHIFYTNIPPLSIEGQGQQVIVVGLLSNRGPSRFEAEMLPITLLQTTPIAAAMSFFHVDFCY